MSRNHRPAYHPRPIPAAMWLLLPILGGLAAVNARASVVAEWNKVALTEVRKVKHGPPMVARALAVAHTCMYDAWAAYDAKAIGTLLGGSLRRPVSERTSANKAQAVSYAAYRCLINLYPNGSARLRTAMMGLGYDPDNTSTDVTTAAGIGNVAAQAVLDFRRYDGANQYGDLSAGTAYAEPVLAQLTADAMSSTGGNYVSAYTGYQPYTSANRPLPYCEPQMLVCGPQIVDNLKRLEALFTRLKAGVAEF